MMGEHEYIAPGMKIKIVDPYNRLSVPIEYKVIKLQGMNVLLEPGNGKRIWMVLDELVVPPSRMYAAIHA